MSGEAPLIQSRSGERSFTATTEAIENLPVSSRNWTSMVALAPGVVGTTRLGGGGTEQLPARRRLHDGHRQQRPDAAAQHGRDCRGEGRHARATRPSTAGPADCRFRPSPRAARTSSADRVYDIKRDSEWNANSWANARTAIAKAVSKQQRLGIHPWRPGGQARRGEQALLLLRAPVLAAHHAAAAIPPGSACPPRSSARATSRNRSTTTNALVNLIRDSTTGLPCTAAEYARLLPGRRRRSGRSRPTGCIRSA